MIVLSGTLLIVALTTAILFSNPSTIADETVTLYSSISRNYSSFLPAGSTVTINIHVSSAGSVNLWIADGKDMNLWIVGHPFSTLGLWSDVSNGSYSVTVPADAGYYFHIENALNSGSETVSVRILATQSVALSSAVVFIVTLIAVLVAAKAYEANARRYLRRESFSGDSEVEKQIAVAPPIRPASNEEGAPIGGARLSQAEGTPTYCTRCGATIYSSDWEFCTKCGASLRRQLAAEGDSTEASTRYEEYRTQKCMVCGMDLHPSDSISRCPHCGGAAHRMHLLEWLHVKGKCPICDQHLADWETVT
jgi:ribosomal protein L37E